MKSQFFRVVFYLINMKIFWDFNEWCVIEWVTYVIYVLDLWLNNFSLTHNSSLYNVLFADKHHLIATHGNCCWSCKQGNIHCYLYTWTCFRHFRILSGSFQDLIKVDIFHDSFIGLVNLKFWTLKIYFPLIGQYALHTAFV